MALVKKNRETMLDIRRNINVVDYVNKQCGYSIGETIDNLYDSNDDWDKIYDLYDKYITFMMRFGDFLIEVANVILIMKISARRIVSIFLQR